jgi:ubiquinone/menaquinone biosynthesis C-methylase UbiE
VRESRPGWAPRRILDIGATVGHNAVPLALGFPDAEVWAIDTAAASLRYGHARARSLGARNIRFVQMSGEDLSRFPDGWFDWVQTTMFLHELSGTALPRVIGEGARVLAPGGLMLHLEQPAYTDAMPLFEQFMRDWDAFNNNEPFWSAMHALDVPAIMAAAGLPRDGQFSVKVAAEVDRDIFPAAVGGTREDYGRAAVWDAYGAWKPEVAAMREAAE